MCAYIFLHVHEAAKKGTEHFDTTKEEANDLRCILISVLLH